MAPTKRATTLAGRGARSPLAGRGTPATAGFSKTTPCGAFSGHEPLTHDVDIQPVDEEEDAAPALHLLASMPSIPSMDLDDMMACFPSEVSYGLEDFMKLDDVAPAPQAFFRHLPPPFDFSSAALSDLGGDAIVPELPTIATPDCVTPEVTRVNRLAKELAAVAAKTPAASRPRRKTTKARRKATPGAAAARKPAATAKADLGLTSTGQVRKRRPKQAVPEDKKDAKYWARRRKNNEAARRNREAKRAEDQAKKAQIAGLDARKQELTDEAKLLQAELAALRELVRDRLASIC